MSGEEGSGGGPGGGAGGGVGSGPQCTVADIALRIQRMTQFVRSMAAASALHGLNATQAAELVAEIAAAQAKSEGAHEGVGEAEAASAADDAGLGWWVLAQGRLLNPQNFAAREAARADLLASVLKAGALVPENIWVWDETGRAQLVLATLPTLTRARRVAARLRQKGLNITVRREMPRKD